jgi:hypothetical protein
MLERLSKKASVFAATIKAGEPFKMALALEEAGIPAELRIGSDDDPYIISSVGEDQFWIYFADGDGGDNCRTYQFHYALELDGEDVEELALSWNLNHRFSRSFNNGPHSFRIEQDYDLEPDGVSPDRFLSQVRRWEATLAALKVHLRDE